jgi:hypothetical protein
MHSGVVEAGLEGDVPTAVYARVPPTSKSARSPWSWSACSESDSDSELTCLIEET